MNPLIILTTLAVWSAASSYSRFKSRSVDTSEGALDAQNSSQPLPGAASSGSSIHSPSYLSPERLAQIVSFSRNIAGSSSDATSFTTSNGISSSHNVYLMRDRPSTYTDENGQSKQSEGNIAMSGHSSHVSPEGMKVSLTWTAADDDDGGLGFKNSHSPRQQYNSGNAQTHTSIEMRAPPAVQAEAYRQARQASLQYSALYGGNERRVIEDRNQQEFSRY